MCVQSTTGLSATSIKSPHAHSLASIPPEYTAFTALFSPKNAARLLPHRPWDCAIDLLSGAVPPRSQVYPLSVAEAKAMEDYGEEALRQGLIKCSTSPASASFFFVEKKNGSMDLDYHRLNVVTIKNPHPLPLIPSATKQLQWATVFTRLDLRCAYNLVHV